MDVQFAHETPGNNNFTSLVDTTGADIFSPNGSTAQSRLRFSIANSPPTFTLGTKIGTGKKASGCRGGSIHGGTTQLRLNAVLSLYGCFLDSAGSIAINNTSGQTVDIAGCTFDAVGSYVLGANPGTFTVYNTTFNSTTNGTFCTSCAVSDSYNMVWAAAAPSAFFLSASPNRSFRRAILSGAVTQGDIRLNNGARDYQAVDLTWSDTPGKPRLISNAPAPDVMFDYHTFDCKVVDSDGNALSGIPVYMENSVDGAVLDDVTEADGNVVFTNGPISVDQVLLVRKYRDTTGSADGSTMQIVDRTFTLWVNSYKSGTNPPVAGRETKKIIFEWPGQDRLGTGYQTDGGSFLPVMTVVRLDPGSPSQNPLYEECLVP